MNHLWVSLSKKTNIHRSVGELCVMINIIGNGNDHSDLNPGILDFPPRVFISRIVCVGVNVWVWKEISEQQLRWDYLYPFQIIAHDIYTNSVTAYLVSYLVTGT